METANSIQAAKTSFEARFSEGSYYNRQTQDQAHLDAILAFLPLRRGMRVLDLGTGSGYLAFALAARHPALAVTGLDIAEKTLEQNRIRAAAEHLHNLDFVAGNGMTLPFADAAFDLVITRYSLHHFPDIRGSIAQVRRVLKQGGAFFLSDPAPNPGDENGFADAYMRLKPDGHIRLYTAAEWQALCGEQGLVLHDLFESSIRFPRKTEQMPGLDALLKQHNAQVIAGYGLEIGETEVWITERVSNLLFRAEDDER
ncbi:MAG: methyltransferase domain-containing protein [Oscillospiraceae bacterium]|nr:methyltransferase domain-containing protein [Oscillospiraceae bacterium]